MFGGVSCEHQSCSAHTYVHITKYKLLLSSFLHVFAKCSANTSICRGDGWSTFASAWYYWHLHFAWSFACDMEKQRGCRDCPRGCLSLRLAQGCL